MTSVPAPPPRWVFGPLTRTDIVRYQGASGDFNPVHHDDEAARLVGHPGAFSAGMLQAGLLSSYAGSWLGTANLRRFTVRFHEQVWPGDVLEIDGEVAAVDQAEGGSTVTARLGCRRRGGGPAVTAVAVFALVDGNDDADSPGVSGESRWQR